MSSTVVAGAVQHRITARGLLVARNVFGEVGLRGVEGVVNLAADGRVGKRDLVAFLGTVLHADPGNILLGWDAELGRSVWPDLSAGNSALTGVDLRAQISTEGLAVVAWIILDDAWRVAGGIAWVSVRRGCRPVVFVTRGVVLAGLFGGDTAFRVAVSFAYGF